MQVPAVFDGTNGGEIFWVCVSINMTSYAIEKMKLEVNDNLVSLEPGSSHLFSENDVNINNEVEQSSLYSSSLLVFHYYFEGNVDVVDCTTSNASFNEEIKMLQAYCIFFKDSFFKPMKVKGDGSLSHIYLICHVI